MTRYYNIHDIVGIASDRVLPELEWCRVEGLEAPSMVVETRWRPSFPASANGSSRRASYSEILGPAGFSVKLQVDDVVHISASMLLWSSPHVLYTNVVEPILRWLVASKGYAMLHAACLCNDEGAFLITAKTDTGKTSTILRLLEHGDYGYLGDDFVILDAEGVLHAYPKPLTISQHTVASVSSHRLGRRERLALIPQSRLHSRGGRQFGQALNERGFPAGTLNALVQRMIPPPKYSIERLIPQVRRATSAPLSRIYIIERAEEEAEVELSGEETLAVLQENTEDAFGFPPYASVKDFLMEAFAEDAAEQERELIRRTVRERGAVTLRRTDFDWWKTIAAREQPLQAGLPA